MVIAVSNYIFLGERSDLSRILQNKRTATEAFLRICYKQFLKKNKKEVTAMSMVSEIVMQLILRIGGYVYGRWKQKVQV